MGHRLAWVLAVSVAAGSATGCGGEVSDDAGIGSDAGGMDAGHIDGGVADGAVVDAGDTDGGDTDGGDTDGGLDGGSDAGLADAAASDAGDEADAGRDGGVMADASGTSITLGSVAIYANCMPIVAPDPIIAFWQAAVTGAPTTVSTATLTSATLTITPSSGAPVVQTLTVDNPSIALSGGSGSEDQRKTAADTTPSGACGSLCSGATYTLALTFDVGGATIPVTENGSFGCVY